MVFLTVLGIYFAILFVVAWISRRNMGMATLSLAAGALLADLWTDTLTPIVANAGVIVEKPPLNSLVAVSLTLIPALIVLIRSPRMTTKHHGLVGSLVFASLAVMLTYGPFSYAVILDEQSRQHVMNLIKYQNIATTVCVVVAIFSILIYRKPRIDIGKHK